MSMRVLIACEYSGIVRRAFELRGHDVISCDFLPSEIIGRHYKGNVLDILYKKWDMLIGHPTCTYLCNSGVRWMDAERYIKCLEASQFFYTLWNSGIPRICLENPIPHKYAKLPKYTQIVHPWHFGHGETKATCFWLKGLPTLKPSNIVNGRLQKIHNMSPGINRSKERSRTYQGIAEAMAKQWG